MEIAGVIFQLVECMSPSIASRWRDHRDVHRNMERLRKISEELSCRKRDIESNLVKELIEGETELRAEVKNWLESAGKISGEVDGIEEKVRKAKLCHAGPGKLINLKRAEVDELYNKGVFPDGLVIHLPRCGYEKPTTSTLGGDTTFQRKMDKIWGCLLDDEITKVGVYGMGGIGKTTALELTHNRLLKDRKDDFKSVIWVTVSKESNILNLQENIARKLYVDLSKDDDVESRAQKLYTELRNKIPYALILDDLWEVVSLKEVGIPEPTRENGCKLVVTTRSKDVCRGMSCKPIEMEVLLEDEALNMFVDQVGSSAVSDPNLAAIVKEVVRECAGLPLAIVTIGGSLKDIVDINEWEIALEELRDLTSSISGGIYERLKFSYDRLSDKKLKECLLYCALYPEDDLIEREMLIEHLMAEGIFEEMKTRQFQIKKGHVMLNKLVNVSLLNDARNIHNEKCVKMHDLVRDMALKITSGSPRHLVKARVGLQSVPSEENWDEDLEKVSLMGNTYQLKGISEVIPTKCDRLSTLLLQRNNLRHISNSFFLHMRRLGVLDLSETDIISIPKSVSDLTTLVALFLRDCRNLTFVPSLARLVNLRLLDLYRSTVHEIPDGLNMATKLRYLNLYQTRIKSIPAGTLCNLVDLQYLAFSFFSNRSPSEPVRFEEIENLRKLENFLGGMEDLNYFNELVRSIESRELPTYMLQLGRPIEKNWDEYLKNSKENKVVILYFLTIPKCAAMEWPLSLPKDVKFFRILNCKLNVENLCALASFKSVTKLRHFSLDNCEEIKHVFSYSFDIFPLLQSLEELVLHTLPDFRGLICREKGTSVPLPHGAFSSLKILSVSDCPEMKKLFMISLLPNLEHLDLRLCSKLMEISIGDGSYMDNEEGEEISSCTEEFTVPKLKILTLIGLPEFNSLPMIADSVQRVWISECPKLRRIPMLDREVFPSSLEYVYIDWYFLESLEWDHPNAKSAISSLCK